MARPCPVSPQFARSRILVSLAGVVLFLCAVAPAGAATMTWNNASGGLWSDPANWTPNQVPSAAGDDAVLPALAGPYRVTLDLTPAIDALRIDAGDPTLDLNGYSIMSVQLTDNYGTIDNFTGAYNSTVLRNHTGGLVVVTPNQAMTAPSLLWNDGRIVVGPGESSMVLCPGAFNLSGTGTLFLDHTLVTGPGGSETGVYVLAGATLSGSGVINGAVSNYGVIECDGTNNLLRIDGIVWNTGTFRVSNSGKINVNRPLMKNRGGTIAGGAGGGRFSVMTVNDIGGTIDCVGGRYLADGGDLTLECGTSIDGEVQRVGTSGAVKVGIATFQNLSVASGAELSVTGHADLMASGTRLLNNGTVRVSGSVNFGISYSPDSIAIDGVGKVVLEGGILGTGFGANLVNRPNQTIEGCGTINPPFVNFGTVNFDCASGSLGTSPGTYTNRKVWRVRSGKLSIINASTVFKNKGTLSAQGGTLTIEKGATVDNTGGGVLAAAGSAIYLGSAATAGTVIGGRLDASGAGLFQVQKAATLRDVTLGPTATLLTSTGGTTTAIGVRLLNQGVNRIAGTGKLAMGPSTDYQQTAGVTLLEGGLITATRELQIEAGALRGNGTITANVASSGEVGPDAGSSPLRIQGNYRQLPAGTLNLTLGGVSPGAISRLDVTGSATLDGALATTTAGGFTPTVGNIFEVLTYGSVSGEFEQYLATTPGGALGLAPQYGQTALTLVMNGVVGVNDPPGRPASLRFYSRHGAQGMSLVLELPQASQVKGRVYDASGREVARLMDGAQPAGVHVFGLDAGGSARKLASGVYFARVEVTNPVGVEARTARVIVIR